MQPPDLFEDVHAEIRGEVGDCLSTQVGQRYFRKRLSAERFPLLVALQTQILQHRDTSKLPQTQNRTPERQRSNLSLVSVDQGRRGSHHGAAPRPGQWRNQGFRHTLGPLLQDLPQSLQVVHQGPVNALLCPVRLQQAPQDGHVKVGGIARSLGQRCWQTCRG